MKSGRSRGEIAMSDISVVLQALEAVEHRTAEHADLPLPSTLGRSRRIACGRDPRLVARDVVNNVLRGELHAAVDLARTHNWFLESPEATEGLAFVLHALVLTDRFEQAEGLIDEWTTRFAASAPDTYQIMLRIEAAIASQRQQYGRALALLRDAYALSDGAEMAQAYTEPALAVAYARADEPEAAHAIIARWPRPRSPAVLRSPLEGSRSLGRMEVALLEERWPAAMRAGGAALDYCQATRNVPLACHVRFCRALAASAAQLPAELEAYRRLVRHHHLPRHIGQLAIIDRLLAMGHTTLRRARLTARTPSGRERLPFVRLWTPRLDFVTADIYWDRVHGVLHLGGDGPHVLEGHPVLHRMFEVLAAEPARAIPIPQLFEGVWGGQYNPLRNEGKVHVTVHRLRGWLKSCGTRPWRSLLEVREGAVGFHAGVQIYVVDLPGIGSDRPPHGERLLQCLAHADALPPRTLERRLGVSRSTLRQALRALLAEKHVERVGRGRATRYRASGE
jgi:hypothetical protein